MENQEAQIRSRITRNDGFKCTLETISIENHNPGGSPRWPRTFRFEKKKLLAKHSYAALLFPSLSRSFYFLTAFYFLTVRLSPFHSTFIHGQTGPFTPIVPAGGHWMLSAVPIQRLFHQLAWNYFERFHRPLNKTNNARTKSRDNVDKRGEIVFRRIEYGREKREEREEEREQRFARRHSWNVHDGRVFSSIFRESFWCFKVISRYFLLSFFLSFVYSF